MRASALFYSADETVENCREDSIGRVEDCRKSRIDLGSRGTIELRRLDPPGWAEEPSCQLDSARLRFLRWTDTFEPGRVNARVESGKAIHTT